MLTTTGIIVMTIYTVTMLYSVVNDTTRKTSQRIGKILLSVGEGILLYTGSVWFLILSLSAIALSSTMLMFNPALKEKLQWELARTTAASGKCLSVNAVIALTVVMTSAMVLGLYGVMSTWGIA
mgnify:FL=1|jgi:hypothetical protein|tara:strand:+ start:215 stop:586 length:372 start_codon:yes stop_codon:yes gene_type:complete